MFEVGQKESVFDATRCLRVYAYLLTITVIVFNKY